MTQQSDPNLNEQNTCSRCVMDTSDPNIKFDDHGVCNHCHSFEKFTKKFWFPNSKGLVKLDQIIERIKSERLGHKYDVIMGLSGGVDSSYLALKMKEYGLSVLAVHVDAGWNSEMAVSNIELVVSSCGFDLKTVVLDWDEIRDLQLAYFQSGVANQDVPQDHAFFANLFFVAKREGIRHIVSGGNIATESIFPSGWHCDAMDSANLRDIQRKFGSVKLKNYRVVNWLDYWINLPYIKKITTIRPLDYLDYNRETAIEELQKIGYKPYGNKHGESRFTRFFQNYFLVKKYGYDKRRPHFSSLIMSGQMSRSEALDKLRLPAYEQNSLMVEDISYVCKKLKITESELHSFIESANRSYTDFSNWDAKNKVLTNVLRSYSKLKIKLRSLISPHKVIKNE